MLTLIRSNLRYFIKKNLLLIISAMVTCGVITGSILIGDSMKHTLERLLLNRIGKIQWVFGGNGKFFGKSVSNILSERLHGGVAGIILLNGSASNPGKDLYSNTQVVGVGEEFFVFANQKISILKDHVLLNESLAEKIGVKEGEELIVRVEKYSVLPVDSPFSSGSSNFEARRYVIQKIIDAESMGEFSLKNNQLSSPSLFMNISDLSDHSQTGSRINALLIDGDRKVSEQEILQTIRECWLPEDSGFVLNDPARDGFYEIKHRQVFLERSWTDVVLKKFPDATLIFSYFVNSIHKRGKKESTPYSIVSSSSSLEELEGQGMIVTDWLAEDLDLRTGDLLDVEYFQISGSRSLKEGMQTFTVKKVMSIEDSDRTLMPEFPGIHESENCVDWEPGIPLELGKIRPRDEEYWRRYKGAPKAFVSLQTARKIWGNISGDLTAIRIYGKHAETGAALETLFSPENNGFLMKDARETGRLSIRQSVDFAQLFAGLGFFIVFSGGLLIYFLFSWNVESRAGEIGLLKAIGFPGRRIFAIFFAEGLFLSIAGSLLGVGAGLIYTRSIVFLLSSLWLGASGISRILFYFKWSSLLAGFSINVLISQAVISVGIRNLLNRNIRENQAGKSKTTHRGSMKALMILSAFLTAFCLLTLIYQIYQKEYSFMMFMLAGAALLFAGISVSWVILVRASEDRTLEFPGLVSHSLKNSARLRDRTIASIAMIAFGIFLVIAVSANRKAGFDVKDRKSPTGGFNFYVETSIPLKSRLDMAGRLAGGDFPQETEILSMRARSGDDASCLNIGRASSPGIIGIPVERMMERGSFDFSGVISLPASSAGPSVRSWDILEQDFPDGMIPVVADSTVIQWGLGKKNGDVLETVSDDGKTLRMKIAGAITDSVFQGNLLISEKNFLKYFSQHGGFSVFLVDCPENSEGVLRNSLSKALRDHGAKIETTGHRLAGFKKVENTYLDIFLTLGGLGLMIGSAGLGVLLLRNLLARRNELALLEALGFPRGYILAMLFLEYFYILAAGISIGTLSGFLSALPAILSTGNRPPVGVICTLVVFIAVTGSVCIGIPALRSTKGSLVTDLRKE